MFFEIFSIVAPVFVLVIVGYSFVKVGLVTDSVIDGLMRFAVLIAIPCLLFRATYSLDLNAAFEWRSLVAYYVGAIGCFVIAIVIFRFGFKKRPGESIGIAFAALFSNLVMLGVPISERAWGLEFMTPNFALIAVNAPICYLIGITVMEFTRADGRNGRDTAIVVVKAMFKNSLMIGIGLGLMVNISALQLPEPVYASIELMARSAIPVALFGLGGVLTRYSSKEASREASVVTALALIIHPVIALWVCWWFELTEDVIRSIVLMAAMAPGLNAYLFATLYKRGEAIAASTVIMATTLSVLTLSLWLVFLR
ncbi:MAG: malonate transporter [Gammaproteobacteria bacterium]